MEISLLYAVIQDILVIGKLIGFVNLSWIKIFIPTILFICWIFFDIYVLTDFNDIEFDSDDLED